MKYTKEKIDSLKKEALAFSGYIIYKRYIEALDEIERLQNIQSAASILGSIKTDKKARSSAENGKKGGRPKKVV